MCNIVIVQMAEFVEFKEFKGDRVLVNIDHIIKVRPNEVGTYLYFDTAIGDQSSMSLSMLHVVESFPVVKRILQQ